MPHTCSGGARGLAMQKGSPKKIRCFAALFFGNLFRPLYAPSPPPPQSRPQMIDIPTDANSQGNGIKNLRRPPASTSKQEPDGSVILRSDTTVGVSLIFSDRIPELFTFLYLACL